MVTQPAASVSAPAKAAARTKDRAALILGWLLKGLDFWNLTGPRRAEAMFGLRVDLGFELDAVQT
jgi:hypothetical protein